MPLTGPLSDVREALLVARTEPRRRARRSARSRGTATARSKTCCARRSVTWAGLGRRVDEDRIVDPELPEEERAFDVALRPKVLGELVGQDRIKEQLTAARGGPSARRDGSTTCSSPVHPAWARRRSRGSSRTRWASDSSPRRDRRSTGRGTGGDPDEPRGGRRPVRGRDPLHAPPRGGGPVSGARGLQARRRARQGPERLVDPARPAPVHVGRRDHPTRADHAPAPGAVRFSPRLDYYSVEDLARIVRRSAGILDVSTSTTRRDGIARRSRARPGWRTGCSATSETSPRCVTTVRSRSRLHARASSSSTSTRRVWTSSTSRCSPRPSAVRRRTVGLFDLAAAVGEETDTIEDVVEPYLMQLGFLKRTPRGRVATERALRHLHLARRGAPAHLRPEVHADDVACMLPR